MCLLRGALLSSGLNEGRSGASHRSLSPEEDAASVVNRRELRAHLMRSEVNMVPEATQDTVLNITPCAQTRPLPTPGTPEWTLKRSFVFLLTEDADGDSDLRHQRTVVSVNTVPPQRQKSEMSSLTGFSRLLDHFVQDQDRSARSDCGPTR